LLLPLSSSGKPPAPFANTTITRSLPLSLLEKRLAVSAASTNAQTPKVGWSLNFRSQRRRGSDVARHFQEFLI